MERDEGAGMAELRLGDQLVRYDRDATLAAYAELQHGDAERCGCSGCRNFIAARAQAFPDTFRNFLAELGIDANKEGEAIYYGPARPVCIFTAAGSTLSAN